MGIDVSDSEDETEKEVYYSSMTGEDECVGVSAMQALQIYCRRVAGTAAEGPPSFFDVMPIARTPLGRWKRLLLRTLFQEGSVLFHDVALTEPSDCSFSWG